ncbi:MAG: hypothetical protein ACI4JE_02815 [Ruminococcus sp.]
MANNVKVIEKNPGQKIEWEQSGTRLYFGDDEIMINAAKYQKDWPVSVDICTDRSGNLTIGTESALRYVAQVEIPAAQYTEDGENREQLPLDMGDVTLTLWSIE